MALDHDASTYTAAVAYELTHGNMQEIYAAEQRTEPWASERERSILEYTEQDIHRADPASRVELDCRRSSCRVRIYSERPHLIEAMGDYPFACLGRYGTADLAQGTAGSRYADFYVLFSDENQETVAFNENRDLTCPKYRERWQRFLDRPFDEE